MSKFLWYRPSSSNLECGLLEGSNNELNIVSISNFECKSNSVFDNLRILMSKTNSVICIIDEIEHILCGLDSLSENETVESYYKDFFLSSDVKSNYLGIRNILDELRFICLSHNNGKGFYTCIYDTENEFIFIPFSAISDKRFIQQELECCANQIKTFLNNVNFGKSIVIRLSSDYFIRDLLKSYDWKTEQYSFSIFYISKGIYSISCHDAKFEKLLKYFRKIGKLDFIDEISTDSYSFSPLPINLLSSEILNYSSHRVGNDTKPYLPSDFDCHLMESIAIISYIVQNFDPSMYCLCFTGGKDCCVVLHILLTILSFCEHQSQNQGMIHKSYGKKLILFCSFQDPFFEMESFMYSVVLGYKLNLIVVRDDVIKPDSMKVCIRKFQMICPSVIYFMMGTRKTDPFANKLSLICNTDAGWPVLVRVFPVLNWSYHDIWDFTKKYKFPYCKLYDEGYTSIGNISTTFKNSTLKISEHTSTDDEKQSNTFLPADQLKNENGERYSRY